MKNKRTVMVFAAYLILIFHLWVQLFPSSTAELFLRQISYIGVDIFFLLSAYSIGSRPVEDYVGFLKSRFQHVYLVFLLFSVIAWLYKGWAFPRFLKVVVGIEFLQKGGGSFLWYVPAIMLMYLLLPLYQRYRNIYLTYAVLPCWYLLGQLITSFTSYTAMFIWWNRIPIILLGFHLADQVRQKKQKTEKLLNCLLAAIILTVVGLLLLWQFGFRPKLQVPICDMFYCMAIPGALGLSLLISRIPENRMIKEIGSATLEMYAVQMIFGYPFAGWIFKNSGNKLVSNLMTLIFVTGIALCFKKIEQIVEKRVSERVAAIKS